MDADLKPALISAIEKNDESEVIRLINAGADINITDGDGQTALFYAVQHSNNESVVRALIDAGADVNITDDDGQTALFHAVQQSNNESVVGALIDAGADVNITDDDGQTALFYAVQQSNNESVVGALIDAGADVNITDDDGQSALFYAVQHSNNESVVRALIDAGADVNITDYLSKTSLLYAVQQSSNESVGCELIDADDDEVTDNDCQTAFNNESVVCALIDAGADVEVRDNDDKTALFYAVVNKSMEDTTILQALIEKGNAFLKAKDNYGRTPLFYAITNSIVLARYLVDHGGSFRAKDNRNVTILSFLIEDCLIKRGSPSSSMLMHEAILLLIEKGLKRQSVVQTIINLVFCKMPILFTASKLETIEECMVCPESVLKALEVARQYTDENNEEQKQAIVMIERETTSGEIFKAFELLAELVGDDPDSCDTAGNTALHYAVLLPLLGASQKTIMDICNKLKHIGAKFDLKNHQNQTPLLFCLSENNWKILSTTNQWSGVKILAEVCKFIMKNGSNVCETLESGESVFHLLMKLFQKALELHDKAARVDILQGAVELLQLFSSAKVARKIVNKQDELSLNSPLHLWASLELSSPQDYTSIVIKDHTFEKFLQIILECLLKCGAKLNSRNDNEETPLHLCKTWSAVKLLIEKGANPNDVDSSGRPPLLVAAKNKTFLKNKECFYPDIVEDPNTFWKTAIEKGLDPWTVDENSGSVLSFLLESEAFVLSNDLITLACKMNRTTSDTKLSLLCAICKDKSRRAYWKSNLVAIILKAVRKIRFNVNLPLRLCCKNIVQFNMLDDKAESSLKEEEKPNGDSVYYEIVKQLLVYGADCRTSDSSGESCLDIAETCPALKDLLTKLIDIDAIPLWIPWNSISRNYEAKLAKTARRQESKIVDQLCYHNDHIGKGSFGLVFAGINIKDGREVAIKRSVKFDRPEDKQEIENLALLADCEQVVRYLSFFEDDDFSYVVLELMEGNLEEYLKVFKNKESIHLCKDVVMGVKYLHEHWDILHRDLKPANILYKTHPKLCFKIADFGLSHRVDNISSNGTNAGTRRWIAPEILENTEAPSKSSDMFSCGLLIHYILSVRRHPFSSTDCANKSESQNTTEIETNIMNGKMDGWDNSLSPEATDLVKKMLKRYESERPTAGEALDHPLFWSQEKKIDLLIAVGNQPVFRFLRSGKPTCLTAFETDLEKSFGTIVRHGKWNDPRYLHMPAINAEMITKLKRSYDALSVVGLVRFIRNSYAHVSGHKRSTPFRKLLLEDFVFLDYFPQLVMEVYKAVTTHGWDQTRDEIAKVICKKKQNPLMMVNSEKSLYNSNYQYMEVTFLIPWISTSHRYKSILTQVAKRQECKETTDQPFWYYEQSIASGKFGCIFAGIHKMDGREVAIKRIEKQRMTRPEDKREIKNLILLADCEQVVRYLSFFEDEHFSYVVLELMEGNLEEYLDTCKDRERIHLCKDVVLGVKYLHEQNILHRDLKPANILYKTHPKLCFKIADFGLSRQFDSTGSGSGSGSTYTTVYSISSGTKCWIAPEVLMSESHDHSKSSDMFSCGLVLHYTLSARRHPFAAIDCAIKSKSQLQNTTEIETNIMKGKMDGLDNSLSPEATDLLKKMLESNESNRPTAGEALNHPLFWSQEKKILFLIAVGNQPEFECPRSIRKPPLTALEMDLERNFSTIIRCEKWNDAMYSHMPAIYNIMKRGRRLGYDTNSVVELVRFIRNTHSHVSDVVQSIPCRNLLLEDFLFLEYFPHLVIEVYKAVTTHQWDQTKDEIKYAMNRL